MILWGAKSDSSCSQCPSVVDANEALRDRRMRADCGREDKTAPWNLLMHFNWETWGCVLFSILYWPLWGFKREQIFPVLNLCHLPKIPGVKSVLIYTMCRSSKGNGLQCKLEHKSGQNLAPDKEPIERCCLKWFKRSSYAYWFLFKWITLGIDLKMLLKTERECSLFTRWKYLAYLLSCDLKGESVLTARTNS